MSWNPYKRIADLERRVEDMYYEMLQLAASNSARLRKLEKHEALLADQPKSAPLKKGAKS